MYRQADSITIFIGLLAVLFAFERLAESADAQRRAPSSRAAKKTPAEAALESPRDEDPAQGTKSQRPAKAANDSPAKMASSDPSAAAGSWELADDDDTPVHKTDQEWKKLLSPKQYRVTRKKQTEMPFTGRYVRTKKHGTYRCVCCGAKLFASDAKFESGTGWPSFYAPVREQNITTALDHSDGQQRVEVQCARCDAHLGHVFDDGPAPTGLRYCINSASLKLEEKKP